VLSDGVHLTYNNVYTAGTITIPNSGGGTSRISLGYEFIALCAGVANTAPTEYLRVKSDGTINTVNGGTFVGNLTGNCSGSSGTFTGSLNGDITGLMTSTQIAAGVILNTDINASAAIADTKLATIATANKVSNSATTATSSNTVNSIVTRDGSGNFSAGTITATVSGSSTSFSGSLSGVVSGTQSATTIASGNITNAMLASAPSTLAAPNTLVLRDGSANITANNIFASEITSTSGNLTVAAASGIVTYGSNAITNAVITSTSNSVTADKIRAVATSSNNLSQTVTSTISTSYVAVTGFAPTVPLGKYILTYLVHIKYPTNYRGTISLICGTTESDYNLENTSSTTKDFVAQNVQVVTLIGGISTTLYISNVDTNSNSVTLVEGGLSFVPCT
jgi:hypothetical protein